MVNESAKKWLNKSCKNTLYVSKRDSPRYKLLSEDVRIKWTQECVYLGCIIKVDSLPESDMGKRNMTSKG